MKCFEITKCTEQDRKSCIVWDTYKDIPQGLENIRCWVIKCVYQEENRAQLLKCHKCQYYIRMNQNSGISSNINDEIALITCEGSINNDKAKALDQIWSTLKKNEKFKVLMDISKVNNIYSCGLGEIVKIHRETALHNGVLVIFGAQETVEKIFLAVKLNHLFNLVPDQEAAMAIFNNLKKKELAAIDAAKPKPAPIPALQVKTRIPCWDYWKGKNPKNVTKCDECFKKITKSKDPCWVINGIVEGITFQFTNEECLTCAYFEEFSISASYSDSENERKTEQQLQ